MSLHPISLSRSAGCCRAGRGMRHRRALLAQDLPCRRAAGRWTSSTSAAAAARGAWPCGRSGSRAGGDRCHHRRALGAGLAGWRRRGWPARCWPPALVPRARYLASSILLPCAHRQLPPAAASWSQPGAAFRRRRQQPVTTDRRLPPVTLDPLQLGGV